MYTVLASGNIKYCTQSDENNSLISNVVKTVHLFTYWDHI